MAEAVGALRVDLFANYAEFAAGLNKADAQLARFARNADKQSKALASAGAKLGIALTAPFLLFVNAAKNAAAEAQDLQGRFDITFDDMADQANAWARTTGDALGRSTTTMQKTAVEFQDFFEDFAPNSKAAAGLSEQFAILAQQLGSFANLSDEQAIGVLTKGLAGSTKGLKRFGLDLSDVAVKQRAVALGIAGANDKLSEQQKVMARASIITQGLAKVQGEIQRSGGEAEESQRQLKESINEMLVQVGNDLLPIFGDFVKILKDVVEGVKNLDPGFRAFLLSIAGVAAAAGPLALAMSGILKASSLLAKAARPLGQILLGVGDAFKAESAAAATATTTTTAQAVAAGRAAVVNKSLAASALSAAKALGTFIVLFPVADAAGRAAGNAIHGALKDSDAYLRTIATAPKFLGGLGMSADEANAKIEALRKSEKGGFNAVIQYAAGHAAAADILDGKLGPAMARIQAGIDGFGKGGNKSGVGEAQKQMDDLLKSFGKLDSNGQEAGKKDKNASEIERLREVLDPTGAALKKYTADMKLAKAAGLDLAGANEKLVKDAIQQSGGLDVFRKHLSELPPEFRKVVEAMDQEDFLKDHAADFDRLREAVDPAGEAYAKYSQDVAIANRMGMETTAVQVAAAKAAIEAAGGVDKLGLSLLGLGPAFDTAVKQIRTEKLNDELKDLAKTLTQKYDSSAGFFGEFQKYNQLLNAGTISVETYNRALDELTDSLKTDEQKDKEKSALKDREKTIREISDAIGDAVTGTRSWSDTFKELLSNMLRTRAIQPFIDGIADTLFGAPKKGSATGQSNPLGDLASTAFKFLGGIFGGGKRFGGSVVPGRAYMVGENGPELFSSGKAGTITPHAQSAGGGGQTNVWNIRTPDPAAFMYSQRQMARRARQFQATGNVT